jgi:hypothetical protein
MKNCKDKIHHFAKESYDILAWHFLLMRYNLQMSNPSIKIEKIQVNALINSVNYNIVMASWIDKNAGWIL